MKNKKQILITGALCIWSAMANAQQIEPLTHQHGGVPPEEREVIRC